MLQDPWSLSSVQYSGTETMVRGSLSCISSLHRCLGIASLYPFPCDSADRMRRFGLAGLARRWLVYPGALIWPSTLASTVLFRALHEPQDRTPANGWVLTRYRFFAYFTIFAFVIFWFPDFIWTSLSAFAFITWLVPHNQKVNAIFGVGSRITVREICMMSANMECFTDELRPRSAPHQFRLDTDQLCWHTTDHTILRHLQCLCSCCTFLPFPGANLVL
jgi:hypothetical protein